MYFCNFFSFLPIFTAFSLFIAYFFHLHIYFVEFFYSFFDSFEIFFHIDLQKNGQGFGDF